MATYVWNIKGRYKAAMDADIRGHQALFSSGNTPSDSNVIDSINIRSTGNAADFGDTTVTRDQVTGDGSSIRFITLGGYTPTLSNVLDYVTYSSAGNAADFGDLVAAKRGPYSAGNNTRGLVAGGYHSDANQDEIEHYSYSSLGNVITFFSLGRIAISMSG